MFKRTIAFLLVLLLLVGCNAKKDNKEIKIISPSGAPAISTLYKLLAHKDNVTIVNGIENLKAAFVSKQSEYQMIIAPINLGISLINAKKTDYRLHSIITWGNLYLVKDEKNTAKKIAVFGDKAVPGLIYNSLKSELGYQDYEEIWVLSVADAQKALLSGEVSVALLAEPAVTATLSKAKQEQKDFRVVQDIQETYQKKFNVKNYPQAGLFIKPNESLDSEIKSMKDYLTKVESNSEQLISDINTIKGETIGVPKAEIMAKAYPKMNISLTKASEVQAEIKAFLELFKLELSEDALIK